MDFKLAAKLTETAPTEALRTSLLKVGDFITTLLKFNTSSSELTLVTVTNEMGKHTVRVNGVFIESFWREKLANTLAERLRVALQTDV